MLLPAHLPVTIKYYSRKANFTSLVFWLGRIF